MRALGWRIALARGRGGEENKEPQARQKDRLKQRRIESMMTTTHFIAIAQGLKDAEATIEQIHKVADAIQNKSRQERGNFDKLKFLIATQ